MRTQKSGRLMSLFGMVGGVMLLATTSAQALLIDDFSDLQTLSRDVTGTSLSNVQALHALGGRRDAIVQVTSAPSSGCCSLDLDIAVGGSDDVLSHSQAARVIGSSTIRWDGDSSTALTKTGLGGVDLTEGGVNDHFAVKVLFDDLPATLQFTIYDMSLNAASKSLFLPGGIFSSSAIFNVLLSDFAGVNLTNVGAIQLNILGEPSTDLTIDYLETTATPEPGTILLLGTGLIGMVGYGWRRKLQTVRV
ncbi:MAG TPA: PEP-CTERM sorting domain-containing protein [Candidatus Tectomicrobia bacterium]